MPTPIDEREQQIAELLNRGSGGLPPGPGRDRIGAERRIELRQLLYYLGAHVSGCAPIKADSRGATPEFRRARKRRQRERHIRQSARPRTACIGRAAFARLLFFPQCFKLRTVERLWVGTEHM